ncbi:MAG: transcription termination factor NusA [Lachnospiraceae bacterium]|nr:transcription termination factor NusA [Lachnospiraceae bacterium]
MKKTKKSADAIDTRDLILMLDVLEKEKGINKENILATIESALADAAREHVKKLTGDDVNVVCDLNREDGSYRLYTKRLIVDEIQDWENEISQEELQDIGIPAIIGEYYIQEIDPSLFSRINTNIAKSKILQALREEEKAAIFNEYASKEGNVVVGTVSRKNGDNYNVNLGRVEAYLPHAETIAGEELTVGERVKVYVTEVKDTGKGPRIKVSRSCAELVKCLFEKEVPELSDGIVEIKNIAREAGSRSKMAVYSTDENIDAVGACVGLNSGRVNAVVDEIGGEKIDIVRWDENPAQFIENALSPAKVIGVWADEEESEAIVIVPDYQLSLAIGNKGQNVRLAAKLTGYKIDIHSETQARESGLYEELGVEEGEFVGYYEEYEDENEAAEDEYDEEAAEDEVEESEETPDEEN